VSLRGISYHFALTIRILNPTGGAERVASTSGVFYESDTLTEEGMFGNTLLAAAPAFGIDHLLKRNLDPDFAKFAILFYRCVPNIREQLGSEREI
jgi:hypothetical protein